MSWSQKTCFYVLSVCCGLMLAGSVLSEPGPSPRAFPTQAATQPQTNSARENVGSELASAEASLERYRTQLVAFRKEYGGIRDLPNVPFFQFGMGLRTKYLFKNGALFDARTGAQLKRWPVKRSVIVPPDYLVRLESEDGQSVEIREDEEAVWIVEGSRRHALDGSRKPVHLPDFARHRYALILRVLHHELLMNVTASGPVPNFYVYQKPWYRDGAMMAMCLKATGNLGLIRDWVLGLTEPYDRNNAGETEADNLGQALYLISLVSDKSHPLVAQIQRELARFEVRDAHGLYIRGRSDFAEHPVYQTKWAKYGLRALGLADPYAIPHVADSYSSLFWMDWRGAHVQGHEATDRERYPYLGWATDHFQGKKLSPISSRDYPLTWEIEASQTNYAGMALIDPVFVEQKTSVPHTWHAAEVFLYLMQADEAGSTRMDPSHDRP